jgi:hypothetical protein
MARHTACANGMRDRSKVSVYGGRASIPQSWVRGNNFIIGRMENALFHQIEQSWDLRYRNALSRFRRHILRRVGRWIISFLCKPEPSLALCDLAIAGCFELCD